MAKRIAGDIKVEIELSKSTKLYVGRVVAPGVVFSFNDFVAPHGVTDRSAVYDRLAEGAIKRAARYARRNGVNLHIPTEIQRTR